MPVARDGAHCAFCGVLVPDPAVGQAYCSPRCRVRAFRSRQPDAATEARTCEHCGEPFTPERRDARFCSLRHRVAAHRARKALQPAVTAAPVVATIPADGAPEPEPEPEPAALQRAVTAVSVPVPEPAASQPLPRSVTTRRSAREWDLRDRLVDYNLWAADEGYWVPRLALTKVRGQATYRLLTPGEWRVSEWSAEEWGGPLPALGDTVRVPSWHKPWTCVAVYPEQNAADLRYHVRRQVHAVGTLDEITAWLDHGPFNEWLEREVGPETAWAARAARAGM